MSFPYDPKTVKERFAILFLNETRTCIFREDVPELMIAGEKLGPFKAGATVKLHNWAIEKLVAHGVIDIDVADAYDSLVQFQNLYNAEEKQPKLQDLYDKKSRRAKLLYSALIRKLNQLQSDKTSIDPRRHDEIEKMQSMLEILVETRLSKLMRAAKPPQGANQDLRKRMTPEEKWLVDELHSLLSTWRGMVTE